MSNILVTGSEGHIGSHVMKLFTEQGVSPRPFDIRLKNSMDMLNSEACRQAVQGMDTVIHLAAIPHPHKQYSGRDYFETNVVGTFNMIEASVKMGVKRFIYSSSTAYYGVAKGIEEVHAPIGDEETLNWVQLATPRNYIPCWLYYGSSKVAAESLLASYGLGKQIEMAILRFSPCPTDESKIESIMSRWGTYVHPEDAAFAIKLAVEYEGELWYERFNISTKGTDTSKAKEILGYEAQK